MCEKCGLAFSFPRLRNLHPGGPSQVCLNRFRQRRQRFRGRRDWQARGGHTMDDTRWEIERVP